MSSFWKTLASLLLLALACSSSLAGERETETVQFAAESVQSLSTIPLQGIPPALVQDAAGVAIIPDLFKAGFLLGGRFGRGVVVARQADGSWSNPIFVTLAGGSIGWQVGLQSSDVVLVFKTRASVERILRGRGKLTLGGDIAVAAGPVGRQAEAATDARLRAEIYSYSRSRGLFAGLSLEGAALLVDFHANQAFYGLPGGHPLDVLSQKLPPNPVAEELKLQISRLSGPTFVVPVQPGAAEVPVPK
jgi:lipid-binding SYLF domain-containing protein